MDQPSDDKRRHFRLGYPEGRQPTVKIKDWQYDVFDLSEGGAKISLANGGVLSPNQSFEGVLQFPDGEIIPINGVVLRCDQDYMALKFIKGISIKRIVAEQVRLRENYPMFLDEKEGGSDTKQT